jgi:hypothetical protein
LGTYKRMLPLLSMEAFKQPLAFSSPIHIYHPTVST